MRNQLMANVGLAITMALVVAVLYRAKQFAAFAAYFEAERRRPPMAGPADVEAQRS